MASFNGLLLVVACAALLQVGCDARQRRNLRHARRNANRRDNNDATIPLGLVKGSNVITLPEIQISGPDVIIGFPDNCRDEGLELLGTELIVSPIDADEPVVLVADDANDPQSNVAIHCNWEYYKLRCPQGVNVITYQYCSNPIPPPPPPNSSSSSRED